MADIFFKKEDFVKYDNRYKVEFKQDEIGTGSDLVVEKKDENGEYEVILAEITRTDEDLFIVWSEPFDGRIVSDQYKQL